MGNQTLNKKAFFVGSDCFFQRGRFVFFKELHMKSSKIIIFILFSALCVTISCNHTTPTPSNGDYHLGSNAGERAAKQDALDYRCIDYPTQLPHLIRSKVKAHLKTDENATSEAYVRGFKWGYHAAFRDYTDTYCGGDRHLELPKD